MSSWTFSNDMTEHRKTSKQAFGLTHIHQLPTEVLAHVFAQLPPSSLSTAQRVCRDWNNVIADEASWRSAFETYYGIHERGRVSLGRRIEPSSWRGEYVSRVAMLHRWHKSRTPSLTYNANVGPLAAMHVALPLVALPLQTHKKQSDAASKTSNVSPTLLAVSLHAGAASLSTPFTGKTAKGLLQATPSDNFGRALVAPLIPVSSIAISPDGSKIIWAMFDGSLRITNCPSSTSTRGWAGGFVDRNDVRTIEDAHRQGTQITSVAFADVDGVKSRLDCFVTTGQDGMVHVWQLISTASVRDRPAPVKKLWSARIEGRVAPATGGPLPSGSCLAFDSGWSGRQGRLATIVVGLDDGSCRAYTDIDLDVSERGNVKALTIDGQGRSTVQTLKLDVSSDKPRALVHRRDEPFFEFVELSKELRTMRFGHKADHIGALTAFAVDFESVLVHRTAPSTPAAIEGQVVSMIANGAVTPTANKTSETLTTSESLASLVSIATTTPDRHNTESGFGERPYVIAGDAHGRTFIWNWSAAYDAASKEPILPQRMIQGFETRVTALAVTEAIVFVGGLDGTVRCYDILTSTLLRTFKDRSAPRLPSRMLAQGLMDADEEERWRVSHIRASRDAMVAAVGGRIIAWKIGTDVRKKFKSPGVGGKMSARTEKLRSDFELRQEVRESLDSLSAQHRDQLERLGQEQRVAIEYGLPPSLDNMTEDEAVALAMMLSVDDEEARWFSDSLVNSNVASPSFGPVPGDILGMEGLSLDDQSGYNSSRSFANQIPHWDDDDDDDDDVHHRHDLEDEGDDERPFGNSTNGSTSLSVPTSPTPRGASLGGGSPSSAGRSVSYSWKPASSHSSPSFSAFEQARNATTGSSKVQVSPRLAPTYGSQQIVAESSVPDMSQELWPTAAAAASSSSPNAQSPRGGSTSPSPAPLSPVSNASPLGRRGWSDVARSSNNASPAPPSLTYTRPSTSKTSLLSTQLMRATNNNANDGSSIDDWQRAERESMRDELRRREEEELRFAIELSLAEEQSRQN
ncbi:hypothetical protein OIO90_006420 [Microbotryomycetes sp. JL221]|nr:hypothetical protein OIO90_006420 [Microbotryomycetes sp. JL221]